MRSALALCLVLSLGCASGTVQTSTGPRPAAEVQIEDGVADTLKAFSDAYNQARLIHDGEVVTASIAEQHARDRDTLLEAAQALRSAWGLLATAKASTSGLAPLQVLAPVVSVSGDLLALAQRLGVLSSAGAAKIAAVIAPLKSATNWIWPDSSWLVGGALASCEVEYVPPRTTCSPIWPAGSTRAAPKSIVAEVRVIPVGDGCRVLSTYPATVRCTP